MNHVTVNDKLPTFSKSAKAVLSDVLKEGARDILIKANNKAPYKDGHLRASKEIKALNPLHYRVSFWEEYARFQEFGGDAKRRVRNYTTSGTGKGYLKSSGDEVADKINRTFLKHAKRARA
jgi:hypothetical protein